MSRCVLAEGFDSQTLTSMSINELFSEEANRVIESLNKDWAERVQENKVVMRAMSYSLTQGFGFCDSQ